MERDLPNLTLTAGEIFSPQVSCPAGKIPVAGGYLWKFGRLPEMKIVASRPSLGNNTWSMVFLPTSVPAGQTYDYVGYAICAHAS